MHQTLSGSKWAEVVRFLSFCFNTLFSLDQLSRFELVPNLVAQALVPVITHLMFFFLQVITGLLIHRPLHHVRLQHRCLNVIATVMVDALTQSLNVSLENVHVFLVMF